MLDFMASSLGEGIELIPIASHSLSEGDDCHGRTIAATKQLFEELKSRVQSGIVSSEIADFFQNLRACSCGWLQQKPSCLQLLALWIKLDYSDGW